MDARDTTRRRLLGEPGRVDLAAAAVLALAIEDAAARAVDALVMVYPPGYPVPAAGPGCWPAR